MRLLAGLAWRTLLAVTLAAGLGLAIGSCFAPSAPTVSWYRIADYQLAWFDDGPDFVVVVRNPEDFEVEVTVACETGGPHPLVWEVDVPAEGEVRALAQVMNRYLVGEPCWRQSWRKK